MATTGSYSKEDLLCPQCKGIYSLPVLLKCGHNTCRNCLIKLWEWKGKNLCPVCGALSHLDRPPINLPLKLAADEYRALKASGSQDFCSSHNERLKIFCHNDEEPICLICQLSKQHTTHQCSPVEEAVLQKKAEISSRLDSLKKKHRILHKTKAKWEEIKTYIQIQARENEVAIMEEFQKLHQFLYEEEQISMNELKREEETKINVMCGKLETIMEQIQTLSSKISDVERDLKKQALPFLQEYKQTKESVKCDMQQPESVRDVLINSAQNRGLLGFQTWRNMIRVVKYAPVILDPNTAQSNVSISPDLSSMKYGRKQLLPNNHERCTNRVCVLGAVGFASGKHSWTVEVSHSEEWHIGVALESIKRKEAVFLKPAEGFWVISQYKGDSLCAEASPRTKLTVKNKPEKVTVELDYDKGKVVFINAADSTTIYTFKGRFAEKVFPFFSLGLSEDITNLNCLTICPSEIDVVTASTKDHSKK